MDERRTSAELMRDGVMPPHDGFPGKGTHCELVERDDARRLEQHATCPGWWPPAMGSQQPFCCDCECHRTANGWPAWDHFLSGS